MKILNLSYDDYANFAHENANALRSVDVDVSDLKRTKHPFGYANESKIATTDQIQKAIQKADIIQIFHSDSTWLDYAYNLGKRVFIYHTGTAYRMNPENLNNIFNGKVERCFTDQCEFIGLGMKNETYIATAIDTENIRPRLTNSGSPLFAHYPSNPGTKGTDKIREMLEHVFEGVSVGDDECFNISIDKLSHLDQLERMRNCFCYIELFAPTQNSRPYGCFGVTAFEAAALGRMVITNNTHKAVYENAYGECELIIANTEEEFVSNLIEIQHTEPAKLIEKMFSTRKWVEKNHSYKSTGEYLKKYLNL